MGAIERILNRFNGSEAKKTMRSTFNSTIFYIIETVAACLFVLIKQELTGAAVFAVILCLELLICDDVMPTLLPFLIICTITTNLYDCFDKVIGYVIYAPVAVVCLIYHYVVYGKKWQRGESVYGILFVTCAIMLSGAGRFTLTEYAMGSYYYLGLGVGMIVAYFLLKSEYAVERDYDITKKFAITMTLLGLLCCVMVGFGYLRKALGFIMDLYPSGFSRNNLSTLLMFSMPFPLYLSKKRKYMAFLTVVMYAGIGFTTSRGGLLFGSAEFAVCCAFWVFGGNRATLKYRIIGCSVAIVVLLLVAGSFMFNVLWERVIEHDATQETRYDMLWQGVDKFLDKPIFGYGLLDNDIAYAAERKKGTLTWYHMMIPQVLGGMGLFGALAYGTQIVGRFKLALTKPCTWSITLGISYLGVLLMSQVNPGEFCPVPFEVFTVLLFVMQENRFMTRSALYEQRIKTN